MTLCTLSPFRRLGVATALLQHLLDTAKAWGADEVYAHVWESNYEALEWYKRRGFVVEDGVFENYYRKLRPSGARIVRFHINKE